MGVQEPPAVGAVARLDSLFSDSMSGVKAVEAVERAVRAVRDTGVTFTRDSLSTSGEVDVVVKTSGVGIREGGISSAVTESEKATRTNGIARPSMPKRAARPAPASVNGSETRPLVWAAEVALKVHAPLGQVYMWVSLVSLSAWLVELCLRAACANVVRSAVLLVVGGSP